MKITEKIKIDVFKILSDRHFYKNDANDSTFILLDFSFKGFKNLTNYKKLVRFIKKIKLENYFRDQVKKDLDIELNNFSKWLEDVPEEFKGDSEKIKMYKKLMKKEIEKYECDFFFKSAYITILKNVNYNIINRCEKIISENYESCDEYEKSIIFDDLISDVIDDVIDDVIKLMN